MTARQRIVRVRREYNQWVANETLEDYALRFTAKTARRWSAARVANTALGAISFLALEAIGGTITLEYGFTNAVAAILAVSALIFATGVPICYYAARFGVDIDLLTRGAGFGYIGSTITSLIYASFTFLFFAIEAVILASMLNACFGLPLPVGYVLCTAAVVPLVMHGITFISRFQLWTQPAWIVLHLLPFGFIVAQGAAPFTQWTGFHGPGGETAGSFQIGLFGAAASVVFSLIAQIGEQVDYLRFLPPRPGPSASLWARAGWWGALLVGGPGWIVPGMLKLLAGSFLATLAIGHGLPPVEAALPMQMYRVAFGYVIGSPSAALVLAACFVAVSQMKINVTNAYAGSIAWSNFFSRLTHSHPGRVVWLVFNLAIALVLMEIGVYAAIEHILVGYSNVAAAWVGSLVADLVVNKPLGLSPPSIEFKRAHLFDFNPVGIGGMASGVAAAFCAYAGLFGPTAQALSPFLAFGAAFAAAPLIAWATASRFYLARKPRVHWSRLSALRCVVCENSFEPEDMAFCPAYCGAICSLCCSLDARCHDRCKPASARGPEQLRRALTMVLPGRMHAALGSPLGQYFLVFGLFVGAIGLILSGIHSQVAGTAPAGASIVATAFWKAFFVLALIAGVVAWLLVLARESQRVAQQETDRQTSLLTSEINAHHRTDAQLQAAKEVAEAANLAKSRFVVGVSHELRSPLNAILGYAQLLEYDATIPEARRESIGIIRRSGEHLTGLIEGLLDISKIEAGRIELYRDEVRLPEFLGQIANMFRLQAEAKGLGFVFNPPVRGPTVVYTDERRLRQILINLLSNAIKFTHHGSVSLAVRWRGALAEIVVADTGIGIGRADQDRVFEPFQRIDQGRAAVSPGVGLGLTITKLLTQIMGGEITLASQPGAGSQFTIRLMLSEVMQPRMAAAAGRAIGGYAGPRRMVVVVDDNPVHRALLEDALVPLGFTVLAADNGADCLLLAARSKPDLFLIDLAMPGMDGWELAGRLRAMGHHTAAIVIVSANAGELRRPPEEGAHHDAVIPKPIDLALLHVTIAAQLALRWTDLPTPGPVGIEAPDKLAAALRPEQAAQLRDLALIGYARGIRMRLDEMEAKDPPAAPAIAVLRSLVAQFRLDEFMAELDRMQALPPR